MTIEPIKTGKYFISHSYKDIKLRDRLIACLPSNIVPYIFPPISVSPLEFASNTLIGAILACDGIIYVNGGFSHQSFWVTFEREYSLRIGKHVFSYDPDQERFEKYSKSPTEMKIFFSAALEDYRRLENIQYFMADRRYIKLILPHDELERRQIQDGIRISFRDALTNLNSNGSNLSTVTNELSFIWDFSEIKSLMSEYIYTSDIQGYLVVFWSKHSLNSKFQNDDLKIATELQELRYKDNKGKMWSKRWGEQPWSDNRHPGYNEICQTYSSIAETEANRILFVKLDETPLPDWVRNSVQLYGDATRSEINRIDDVIVRIYWLIHHRTSLGQTDEEV